jgi:hypothetical protein
MAKRELSSERVPRPKEEFKPDPEHVKWCRERAATPEGEQLLDELARCFVQAAEPAAQGTRDQSGTLMFYSGCAIRVVALRPWIVANKAVKMHSASAKSKASTSIQGRSVAAFPGCTKFRI